MSARDRLLAPLAYVYAAGSRLHRRLYDRGVLGAQRIGVPVVSVGNVVVGGSGKTPVVIALARRYLADGYRVAVLLRGYKRRSRGRLLVADERGIRASYDQAGDEAILLARSLAGASVVVAEDRARAARWVERVLEPDVIVLDDGFQHFRLGRDVDIVVFDATTSDEALQTLPAGRLREPLDVLARADLILLTRTHLAHDQIGVRRLLRQYAGDVPTVDVPQRAICLKTLEGERLTLERVDSAPILALSGIGNPLAFEADLRQLGADIVGSLRFRDHHHFGRRDVAHIERALSTSGATCVVTTSKDMVRLESLAPHLPIYALEIELDISASGELWSRLQRQAAAVVESRM